VMMVQDQEWAPRVLEIMLRGVDVHSAAFIVKAK
jgi:hypothetical protein